MTLPDDDPTAATSEKLNRRVFVGISGAAAIAASAPAGAQEELGHPHPPLVAENDPAITVDHFQLQSEGATIPAYAAWPVGAGAGTPSVVVIMHIWGVDTSIRDFVRRLAKTGFAAIANGRALMIALKWPMNFSILVRKSVSLPGGRTKPVGYVSVSEARGCQHENFPIGSALTRSTNRRSKPSEPSNSFISG